MCFLRHARGSGWLVPRLYRETTTPPRPHHTAREKKWAMRDDGPSMSRRDAARSVDSQ